MFQSASSSSAGASRTATPWSSALRKSASIARRCSGLTRRIEEQVGPSEAPLRRRDLAVEGGVGHQRLLDAPALGVFRHGAQVLAGITIGPDGQDLEPPPDAGVGVGDGLECGIALDVPHELDAQWRKL